jgi:MFS family permease
MFFPTRSHYFSHTINKEVKEVFWQAFLANMALSITMLFEPIFLYQLGYSLINILWFYCLVYIGYIFLVFLGAKIISKIGYKHAMFWSNIIYVLYWILLYQIQYHPVLFFVAPFMFAAQKSLFWPAYHADISMNSAKDQEGREVGALFSIVQAGGIVGPLLGGLLSGLLGFKALFFVSSVLMLISVYPLFRSSEIFTKHAFRFRTFWKILRERWVNFFAYWGYGEDLMIMSLWPIFVFLAVPTVINVGILVTVASLVAIVIMLYIGKVVDSKKHNHLLQFGSIFYGFTWFFRQFATTFPIVFAFDALTRTGKAMVNVPMMSMSYKIGGSSTSDYAVAYGVLHEFSLSVGKVVMALLGIWILTTTQNIYYVFVLAGAMTMFYSLLREKK